MKMDLKVAASLRSTYAFSYSGWPVFLKVKRASARAMEVDRWRDSISDKAYELFKVVGVGLSVRLFRIRKQQTNHKHAL
jgi:hypothetical protein